MPWSRQFPPRARDSRAIPSSEIQAQLERILASPDFDVPERARTFLNYVVTESLSGRADRIKAYTIAVEVFGRGATFDPQSDPVVRIEAGRVRRGLERYYLTAGSSDPIVITIPKGSYAPAFSRHTRGRATGFGSTQVCVASRKPLTRRGGCGFPCWRSRPWQPLSLLSPPWAAFQWSVFTTQGRSAFARPRCQRAEYPETSGRAVSGCDGDRGGRNHRHRD